MKKCEAGYGVSKHQVSWQELYIVHLGICGVPTFVHGVLRSGSAPSHHPRVRLLEQLPALPSLHTKPRIGEQAVTTF